MKTAAEIAIAQLDDLLTQWHAVPTKSGEFGSWKHDPVLVVRIKDAVLRLAPPSSFHAQAANNESELLDLGRVAQALRADYISGYLQSLEATIHANVFADFLEAAEHLIYMGYKDAAAVLIGGVLETHLRQLATKHGVTIGKAESMNTDLRTAQVYDLNTQKHVTSMLGLRNSAAHAQYADYDSNRIKLYVAEVRHFVDQYPA